MVRPLFFSSPSKSVALCDIHALHRLSIPISPESVSNRASLAKAPAFADMAICGIASASSLYPLSFNFANWTCSFRTAAIANNVAAAPAVTALFHRTPLVLFRRWIVCFLPVSSSPTFFSIHSQIVLATAKTALIIAGVHLFLLFLGTYLSLALLKPFSA